VFGITRHELDTVSGMVETCKRHGFVRNVHTGDGQGTRFLQHGRAVPGTTGHIEHILAFYVTGGEVISSHMLADDMGARLRLRDESLHSSYVRSVVCARVR
jgi:hypothetical protein